MTWNSRMHRLAVTLCLGGALMLAACAPPPSPAPSRTNLAQCMMVAADAQAPVTCSEGEVELMADACDDVVAFDAERAYQNARETDLLGWTLTVSFDAVIGEETAPRPLGCLRLYRRDDGQRRFVPARGGTILFDTCQTSGHVTISDGRAHFGAGSASGGTVTCAIDLAKWVGDFQVNHAHTAEESGGILMRTIDFAGPTSIHQYPALTLVARVEMEADDPFAPNGSQVFRYLGADTEHLYALTLATTGTNEASFEPACPDVAPPPVFKLPLDLTAWRDLNEGRMRNSYEPAEGEPILCDAGEGSTLADFWIGPATLEIGAVQADNAFAGSIDGVLVDPFDSKPAGK